VVVVLIEPAMLGDLATSCKDDTGVRLEDDVRGGGVVAGRIELLLQRLEREDLLNAEGSLVLGLAERGDGLLGEFG